MNNGKTAAGLVTAGLLITLALAGLNTASAAETGTSRPALTVKTVQPQLLEMPLNLSANGSITAWQEAVIGAEVADLHLKEVRVEVGESVRKNQILAVFEDESVNADVAQNRAALAEAAANLAEARLNAARARQVADSGALSTQQIDQYLTAEKTALAKQESAQAQLDAQLLRLKYTRVVASDDGVISARSATLGAVVGKGQELFRMIRQNRLEWRAEVTAQELAQLQPGMPVNLEIPNVGKTHGKIRSLSPALDVQTRNALVYVDLPEAYRRGFRAGMFAGGEFHLGTRKALCLPQEAISLREGFSYVFRLDSRNGDQAKVSQIKVQLGRRNADYLEILAGVNAADQLVAAGATFLTDGDNVRIVP